MTRRLHFEGEDLSDFSIGKFWRRKAQRFGERTASFLEEGGGGGKRLSFGELEKYFSIGKGRKKKGSQPASFEGEGGGRRSPLPLPNPRKNTPPSNLRGRKVSSA